MYYASTFLSHSSSDKTLVEAVANELGRRGIVAWLDKYELVVGSSLTKCLEQAIRQQATVTVFLSEEAIKSTWVEKELLVALELDFGKDDHGRIMPVYIGEAKKLVKSSELLCDKWIEGDNVDILGVCVEAGKTISATAQEVAEKLARRVYQSIGLEQKEDVVVYVDQRGEGARRGVLKNPPKEIQELNIPALVFRPDQNLRKRDEVLTGESLENFCEMMRSSLATALDGVCWRGKGKKIRIMGNSQLAIPFMLGQYFNRSTHAMLFCSNNDGTVFTNEEQDWYAPLTGGNADCLSTEDAVPALPKDWKSDSVCLLLGRGYLIPDVQEYLAQHPELPSLLWVENGTFNDNQEAMQYVADVVALLLKIKKDAGVRTVYLFCGLPFILLPILSANLHHVMNRVFFMEHGKDLQESSMSTRDMYSVC